MSSVGRALLGFERDRFEHSWRASCGARCEARRAVCVVGRVRCVFCKGRRREHNAPGSRAEGTRPTLCEGSGREHRAPHLGVRRAT